jgi:uncharacterized membrane protein
MRIQLFILLLICVSSAFTIESYESNATVLQNGDLNVNERIVFDLEKQHNEGFRTIRSEDAPSLDTIVLHSVKVNGAEVNSLTQIYEGAVEIVWTKTFIGKNVVELNYSLKDRVELYNDYARICFEHFSSNWKSEAKKFESRMILPEAGRGKPMHFQIYSSKMGNAYVDDLDVVVEMDNVPPSNYIGGCYLFDRGSVNTDKIVNGSAYEILQDERKSYGAAIVFGEEPLAFEFFCFPAFLILSLFTVNTYLKRRKPKYPETILPPEEEEPAVVAALVLNKYPEKDLIAATLIDLINRGVIEIIETFKGATDITREKTILFLKKKTKLKPHEQPVVDMIFQEGKEVDLDALAEKQKKIRSRSAAKADPAYKAMKEFKSCTHSMLANKKVKHLTKNPATGKMALFWFILVFGGFFLGFPVAEAIFYHLDAGNIETIAIYLISIIGALISFFFLMQLFAEIKPPARMEEKFEKWDSFYRAVKSSRLDEYPPSSVAIWGKILVFATALGMADKVMRHLSELDELTLQRVKKLQEVRASTFVFYRNYVGTRNLAKTGNRSGYSRSSSGSWSTGGGGFSSGSSGGGGFR